MFVSAQSGKWMQADQFDQCVRNRSTSYVLSAIIAKSAFLIFFGEVHFFSRFAESAMSVLWQTPGPPATCTSPERVCKQSTRPDRASAQGVTGALLALALDRCRSSALCAHTPQRDSCLTNHNVIDYIMYRVLLAHSLQRGAGGVLKECTQPVTSDEHIPPLQPSMLQIVPITNAAESSVGRGFFPTPLCSPPIPSISLSPPERRER